MFKVVWIIFQLTNGNAFLFLLFNVTLPASTAFATDGGINIGEAVPPAAEEAISRETAERRDSWPLGEGNWSADMMAGSSAKANLIDGFILL